MVIIYSASHSTLSALFDHAVHHFFQLKLLAFTSHKTDFIRKFYRKVSESRPLFVIQRSYVSSSNKPLAVGIKVVIGTKTGESSERNRQLSVHQRAVFVQLTTNLRYENRTFSHL